MTDIYDLIVIGGGVNGTGIARDAQGRGLKTLLVEQGDLASATSSASTKIIHGGLRYLEQYQFRLVREALKEREVLLKNAPHIMWPLEFILPHHKKLRPSWMIRLGLFLYDHMATRNILKGSRKVSLNNAIFSDTYKIGFSYWDGWVEDSRLSVLNAVDAKERGADIRTYTKCVGLKEDKTHKHFTMDIKDVVSGKSETVTARSVINAAGPWVDNVLSDIVNASDRPYRIKLVKGSHIIVPKMYEGENAHILQNEDGRIVFTFPYEDRFTMIGTTDEEHEGDPSTVQMSDMEAQYLCDTVNQYFKQQISPNDIVAHYSGVRPLLEEPDKDLSEVTRDYKLHRHQGFDLPFITVYGGKITTYRKLSEKAVNMLCDNLVDPGKAWTSRAHLPGGKFVPPFEKRCEWLPDNVHNRWIKAYGTRLNRIIGDAKSLEDLGEHLGDHIYAAEIDYLIKHEFAKTLDDIVWRRSKLALHCTPSTLENLQRYLESKK